MGYISSYTKAKSDLRKAVSELMRKQKDKDSNDSLYAVIGYITEDKKLQIDGSYYPYALVVDIDLYEGKKVVCTFDKSKQRAFIIGD